MERGVLSESAQKRPSYRPATFSKKLQKSREISNFTAFYGGLEGDRTLDLCDANAALSQLSYEPVELLCSSESYYTIISTVVKTIFFGTRKIFCCQFGHPIVK